MRKVPSCNFCNQADCGKGGPPGSPAYVKQQHCAQRCAGGGTDGEKNNNQSLIFLINKLWILVVASYH